MTDLLSSETSAGEKDMATVNRVRRMFDEARAGRRKKLGVWEKNYRLVHNETWYPGRGDHLPSPTSSECYPILAALVGWMTDMRPEWQAVPAADPNSAFYDLLWQLSHDLENLLRSLWFTHDYAGQTEIALHDGFCYGIGILKVFWDPNADDGAGNAIMRRVDPWTFYPDPLATDFENARYLIESRKVTFDELEERFPGSSKKVQGGDDSVDSAPEIGGTNSQPRGILGGTGGNVAGMYGAPGPNSGAIPEEDTIVLHEAWLREHDTKDDQVDVYWRNICVAGDTVLLNEKAEDLWAHGRHPFARYVFDEQGELFGEPLVKHLADHQLSINRLLAAFQNNIELLGNPPLIEDARAGLMRSGITARPGQRLKKGVGSEVLWLPPPAMPSDTLPLIEWHKAQMERISGLSAIARGSLPTGRNAQGVIDAVQESSFVRVRKGLRNLERTLRQAGELAANLIAENYTAPRIASIVGPQGEMTAQAFKTRHFYKEDGGEAPLRFSLFIKAGSATPISRQARASEAMTLYGLGAIDIRALLMMLDIPGAHEIAGRIEAQMAAGTWQPPGARQRSRS